jgi:hypothetical protein
VRSSKSGGSTTTPTDRIRASTGSHQLSSQHAPRRGKTGTDSPYERGQIGEQVRCQSGALARRQRTVSAKAAAAREDLIVRHGPMLFKKAEMNRSKFLPLPLLKLVFRNPTHPSDLTKAAGWKSDRLYVPHIRTTAPVSLKKSGRSLKNLFQQRRSLAATSVKSWRGS